MIFALYGETYQISDIRSFNHFNAWYILKNGKVSLKDLVENQPNGSF